MTTGNFILIGLLAMGLILVGCAGPTRLEIDYGTSVKLSRFNQTLNPEAEKNLEPVVGFDGEAARGTIDRYHKGFEVKTPPPTYVLSIGGIGTSGR